MQSRKATRQGVLVAVAVLDHLGDGLNSLDGQEAGRGHAVDLD
jgi:hypothetical protein